jgi:hypothetical protein
MLQFCQVYAGVAGTCLCSNWFYVTNKGTGLTVLRGVLHMPWKRRATFTFRSVVLASFPLSSLQMEVILPIVVVRFSFMM